MSGAGRTTLVGVLSDLLHPLCSTCQHRTLGPPQSPCFGRNGCLPICTRSVCSNVPSTHPFAERRCLPHVFLPPSLRSLVRCGGGSVHHQGTGVRVLAEGRVRDALALLVSVDGSAETGAHTPRSTSSQTPEKTRRTTYDALIYTTNYLKHNRGRANT